MARLSLALIRAYQLTLGPVLGLISHCRYHPTCSHYGAEAIRLSARIQPRRNPKRRIASAP